MEILMTGEIYLKKGPDIIKFNPTTIEDEEEFEMFIEDLKSVNAPERTIEDFIRRHEEELELKGKGYKDYSGCSNFWMSVIDENGIEMVEKDYVPNLGMKRKFTSKEEVDKEFIRLRVFLENAKFVGKYFKRTGYLEINHPDGRKSMDTKYNTGYFHRRNTTLVLYEFGENLLAQTENGFTNEKYFEVIPRKYLEDGKYELYGDVPNEYDKTDLYQAILKQSLGAKKKKL